MFSVLKKRKNQKYILIAIVVSLLLITTPGVAQVNLQDTMTRMQEQQQWWEDLWQQTFEPNNVSNNISLYTLTTVVRTILGVSVIFWLYKYGQKMIGVSGYAAQMMITAEMVLPALLIALFLSNQAHYSRLLAYGMRDVINSWSTGVMSQQLQGERIQTALNDQLLLQDAKNEITSQGQKCLQMPQPAVAIPSATRPTNEAELNQLTIEQLQVYDFLECIEKLGELADQRRRDSLTTVCGPSNRTCAALQRYWDNFWNSITTAHQKQVEQRVKTNSIGGVINSTINSVNPFTQGNLFEIIGTSLASAGYQKILNFVQWMWMGFLELALWLNALFAPIFIAASIIPGQQNLFVTWIISFLTIGLAKVSYLMVIGIVAIQLSQTSLLAEDLRFPMALGLFAPGVSLAVVTAGGIAAASSFRSQSVGLATTAASVAAGTVGSIGFAMIRYSDKRR